MKVMQDVDRNNLNEIANQMERSTPPFGEMLRMIAIPHLRKSGKVKKIRWPLAFSFLEKAGTVHNIFSEKAQD